MQHPGYSGTHYAHTGYPWYDPYGFPQEGYWLLPDGQVWQPSGNLAARYGNQIWVPSQPLVPTRDGPQTDILQPSDGRTSSRSSRHAPSASNRSRSRPKKHASQEGRETRCASNRSRSRAKKHASQEGQETRNRERSRPKAVKTGVRTESQEGHGQEGEEGERRKLKSPRAKETKKGTTTNAKEPDGHGPLVILVSAGTGEAKKIIQERLEVACNAKPAALIFTLDRDRNTVLEGKRTTKNDVKELLEIGKSRLEQDGASLGQYIFSNEVGANIAVCWDMHSLLCDKFEEQAAATKSPTEATSHTLFFQMIISHKKEAVHCAILQIEERKGQLQVIQGVWNQLPMPCFIAGNLVCPRIWLKHGCDEAPAISYASNDLKHGCDEANRKLHFQAFEADSAVWPQPFFIGALGPQLRAHQGLGLPVQSTLVIQLQGGSANELEAAPEEEPDSEEDISPITEPATAEDVDDIVGMMMAEDMVMIWAAFTIGIMGWCCGDQGLSETEKQRLTELAQHEANLILLLEEGSRGRRQEVCQEIRNLERWIGWTDQGDTRSLWPTLNWWVICELCKRQAQRGIQRHYDEPLHDLHQKCLTYLARRKWSKSRKQPSARWEVVDDDRYPHLKMSFTKDADRRRFRAFVRSDIGHKDIPYFIWTHGLPGCLKPETDATADLDRYTKELVNWLWKLAEYIVVTRQETGNTPHRMQRMMLQVDNAPMLRRLKC